MRVGQNILVSRNRTEQDVTVSLTSCTDWRLLETVRPEHSCLLCKAQLILGEFYVKLQIAEFQQGLEDPFVT